MMARRDVCDRALTTIASAAIAAALVKSTRQKDGKKVLHITDADSVTVPTVVVVRAW